MTCDQSCQVSEARLLLRWAAAGLTKQERFALGVWLAEVPEREAARQAGVSRAAVWMARQSALRKMRARMTGAGITSVSLIVEDR